MKKYYILAAVAVVMAFSCQKANNAPEQSTKLVTRTFTCTIGGSVDPDSKVAISETDGAATWEVGDEILVHGAGSSNKQTITLTAADLSEDKKTATITITSVEPYDRSSDKGYISTYYASYPASASADGNLYYYARFNNTNLPLMAAYNKDDSFVFHNLCGIISFIVDGDYDSYTFIGNNGETIGYSAYQVRVVNKTGNVEQLEIPYVGDGWPSGPLTTISGSLVADGETVNKICFPDGVSFSAGFTIYFLKDDEIVKELSTTESVEVPRNSYRPMGDITSYLKNYTPVAPPATNHYKDLGATFTNASALDAAASANCYILTEKGTYKFKAVEGNDTDAKLTTIASVEIVWETLNTDTALDAGTVIASADYHYKQAGDTPYIVFSTPEALQAGNALIAAKDDHEDIIWSWHIWIPAETVTSADYTSFIGGTMMNMNLGALRAVPATGSATIESLGLLYQWGRKDPFVGAMEWNKYPDPAEVAGTEWTTVNNPTSIAESIKNPTVYYFTNKNDDGDWNITPDATLWNNSGSKAKYDPCPPGYKVPVNTGALWTKTDEGWNFDKENHVSVHTASGVRLPMAGFIESYSGGLNGTGLSSDASSERYSTYIWSATEDDTNTRAKCVLIRSDKSPVYYKAYRGKANAGSVRCIAE